MTAPGGTAEFDAFRAGDDGAASPCAPVAFSIGGYLAAQRRLRGLSLEELEAATRIPLRSLARLEAGAFDRQHDAFVRGFVRTVAVAIGLDPVDTMVRMLAGEAALRGRTGASPLRTAAFGVAVLVLAALVAGAVLGIAGRLDVSRVAALLVRPAEAPIVRRDSVVELAERVRTATPGSFTRPRPVAPPPAMFVSPAGPEIALDAVFPRPGADRPSPAAVSSSVQ